MSGPDHRPCRHRRAPRRPRPRTGGGKGRSQEFAVAQLRKGREIGDLAFETEATEPSIRQIEMDLLAWPAFRPDHHSIADDEHADDEFRVDQRPPGVTVRAAKICVQFAEIEEAVDPAHEVVLRNIRREIELAAVRKIVTCQLPIASFDSACSRGSRVTHSSLTDGSSTHVKREQVPVARPTPRARLDRN